MDSINISSRWLKEFIIDKNICPFAKEPFENGLVHLAVTSTNNKEKAFNFFLDQLQLIQTSSSQKISNSLLIFENGEKEFFEFLEFFYRCESLLEEIFKVPEFQVVCFHPKFKFEGESRDARINWVNRSPFPSIHILRCSELEVLVEDKLSGEMISQQNEKTLNALEEKEFESIKELITKP